MTLFHRIWLITIALFGVPIACLGLILAIPAVIDLSPAVFLLLIPAVLIIWDITLIIRGKKIQKLRINLFAFYTVAGAISIWSSTWTFNRDGATGYIFNPEFGYLTGIFFLVPIVVLIFTKPNRKFTETADTLDGDPESDSIR